MGAKVDWNDKTKQVDIKKDNVSITIRINDRNIVVNTTIKTMDTKAIIRFQNLVPIRYVKALELNGWNANTKTVIITTGGDVIKSYSKDYYRINPEWKSFIHMNTEKVNMKVSMKQIRMVDTWNVK